MRCILCIVFYAVCSMNYILSISNFETRWSRQTDRQTDRPNDGRTDIVLYRAAIAAQKSTTCWSESSRPGRLLIDSKNGL